MVPQLKQNIPDHFPANVRQSEIAAGATMLHLGTIHAEQGQHGSAKAVNRDAIFRRLNPNSSVAP
jgi:hypothetical protein